MGNQQQTGFGTTPSSPLQVSSLSNGLAKRSDRGATAPPISWTGFRSGSSWTRFGNQQQQTGFGTTPSSPLQVSSSSHRAKRSDTAPPQRTGFGRGAGCSSWTGFGKQNKPTFGTTPSSPTASPTLVMEAATNAVHRSSVQVAPLTRTGYSMGPIEPIEEEETRGYEESELLLHVNSDSNDNMSDNGNIITTSGTQKGPQQATPGPDDGYIQSNKKCEHSQLHQPSGGVVR